MAELLDANWLRACVFGVATVALVLAWRHERGQLEGLDRDDRRILWPTCWLLIAAVYALMALALGLNLAGTVGGLGREYARNEEWYDSRRPLQASVVAIVGVVWLTTILVGIWRVPERRRRYLASALLCTTLVCFATIRMISFHYIDAVLVRVSIAGVPVSTVIEFIGIGLAVILVATAVRRPVHDPGVPSPATLAAQRA